MKHGPERFFFMLFVSLASLTVLASTCREDIDPRCAKQYTHMVEKRKDLKAELAFKEYDLGKVNISAKDVKSFNVDIDSILEEHNMMSSNLCNMWANGVIGNEKYFSTQTCYDSNQRKLRTHVLSLKSAAIDMEAFSEEIKLLFGEYDKCVSKDTSDPGPVSDKKSKIPGSPCESDANCVKPLYCILGECNKQGGEGAACVIDIDCSEPLMCMSGTCSKQGPSTVINSACVSDTDCDYPLFCILGGCRPLGKTGDACGQNIDCYMPLACTNGKCAPVAPVVTTTTGPSSVHGTPCTNHAECAAPLFCIKKTCRHLGNLGDVCDVDADCYSPYTCQSGFCGFSKTLTKSDSSTAATAKTVTITTVWSTTIKANVSTGSGGGGAKACTKDAECVSPDYCIVKYCRPLQPVGGVCDWNPDCAPDAGPCINGFCGGVDPSSASATTDSKDSCTGNHNCPKGHTCVDGVCQPAAFMTACGSDSDCPSPYYCIVDACRELQDAGGVCNINLDCKPPLVCTSGTCAQ